MYDLYGKTAILALAAGLAGVSQAAGAAPKGVPPDTTAPTVVSILRESAGNPTNGATVTYRVTFSENILDSTIADSDFTLTAVGVSGAFVQSISTGTANDAVVDVEVNTGGDDGSLRLDVLGATASITDAAGNDIAADFTAGEAFTIDKTAPTASSVTIASDNATPTRATTGHTITVSIAASEAVTPTATLLGRAATITSLGGNNYTASVMVELADFETAAASFTVQLQDAAGNTSTVISTTTDASSVRIDKTVPTATTVSIASSHTNPAWSRPGHTVTVAFTATEPVTPTVTIHGHPATINALGGNNYAATYTLVAGDSEIISMLFSILLTDVAGNTSTPITATTDSSTVRMDKTPVTVSPLTIASNNANPALAKLGDTITVSYTVSQDLDTNSVTIAGAAAPVVGTYPNYTATRTVQAGDTEGPAFSISVTDLAGNLTVASATTDASSVAVDLTPPTSSASAPDPAQAGGTIDGAYSASDPNGVAGVVLYVKQPGGAWTAAGALTGGTFAYTPSPAVDGAYQFATVATDAAGNAETAPAGADPGDTTIHWNDTENSSFQIATITGPATYVFPLSDSADVEIAFSAGTTGGPITVTRQAGDFFPIDYDSTKIADETLSITGSFTGGTATLSWRLDPASIAALSGNPLNTVFQFESGVLAGTYPVTPAGTVVTAGPLSTFSEWYAGSNNANIPGWELLND